MDSTPGLRQNFLRGIPMGRLGVPADIKGLALFLASDASSFTTGAIIGLDGGNLAMNAGGTHGHRASDAE
jgi:gluconate 5-dehydrogenase